MRGVLLSFYALAVACSAMAQSTLPAQKKEPIRLQIRHADPWFVKAMLEGIPVQNPEISTLPGFAGLGNAAGQGLGRFLSTGKLVVNPTDNSLWFFPD